jgi:XTP/dITP diphosphohydrolase
MPDVSELWPVNQIVIATNNAGKLAEIQSMLSESYTLLSLEDIGFRDEIEEPFDSFEENAHAKAATVFAACGKSVLADDSGICVNALNGAPGVYSARYGGEPRSDASNNRKLLEALAGEADRSAFYKAVICLIWEGEPYFFEGICRGHILEAPRGQGGFGYDPLFVPDGYDQSFGELPPLVKKQVSHRAQALKALTEFLNSHALS